MALRIERPAVESSAGPNLCERSALDAAYRALAEVQENAPDLELLPPPGTADELRNKAQSLAKRALAADKLTTEGPEGPLHQEFSKWGKPGNGARGIPRELLAADVLDFLASLLGTGATLVCDEDRN